MEHIWTVPTDPVASFVTGNLAIPARGVDDQGIWEWLLYKWDHLSLNLNPGQEATLLSKEFKSELISFVEKHTELLT